jgi:sigma-E factor negative regulatory protein RseA
MHTQIASRAASAEDEDTSWEQSVSAWMDGEGAEEWLDGLSVAEGKETWDTYHLIGDVLRNPELSIDPSKVFRARLANALANELPIVASPRRRSLRPAWRFGLSGFAVAAAVATVTWVAQPYLAGNSDAPTAETRVIADASSVVGEDPSLSDYLEAHRQLAGPTAVRQVSFDVGAGR